VLFERNETKKTCEYKFHTEFQSHEPEFDYLKSLEIEEKINKIKWCKRQNQSHYLLSTNDKTIKLWKVFEKSLKVVAENNLSSELTPAGASGANGGGPVRYPNQHFRSVADLKFPRMTHHDTVVAAVPRKVYANAHAYHINSISVNSDGETFISSDDLRINLWNLNIQDQSFNIVDIKPANMEELTEVITAAEFHPTSCNWFMYASSKGTIKLADMRQKALCDEHAKRKFSTWSILIGLRLTPTQNLNKKRTHPRAHSSLRSSPPSRTSALATTVATSSLAITLLSRSGT
jgi:serine/threonine-protein phosphatase 2A regulatory subunit B